MGLRTVGQASRFQRRNGKLLWEGSLGRVVCVGIYKYASVEDAINSFTISVGANNPTESCITLSYMI